MDYNIYIHDKTSGQSKPTQARVGGGTNTTPKESASQSGNTQIAGALAKYGSAFLKYGGSGLIVNAVFKEMYRITDKVVSTIEPFVTRETGDYRFNVTFNNVKAVLLAVNNPAGSLMNYATYQQEIRLFNQRQEQARMLLGEGSINSASRKV